MRFDLNLSPFAYNLQIVGNSNQRIDDKTGLCWFADTS